jgi:hypothetical protein
MPRTKVAFILVVVLYVGFVHATDEPALVPAPGRRVISLTPIPGRFSEPSIAINTVNPKKLVAAFQSNASVGYSTDGGETWNVAEGTAPANYKRSGDVTITYDHQGHAILCFIAFDQLGTWKYWAHNATRNGVFVRRSLDGGKTWEANAVPVIEHASQPGIPFEDKPYIVADNQPQSPHLGNLYVGWSQDRESEAAIVVSRSTDGGLTWSKPVQVNEHPGLPRDDNGTVEGFSGVVTPDGALHVIWSDTDHIVYSVSRDGGRTFSHNRILANTGPSHFFIFNAGHANGYPQIDTAKIKGRKHSALYITWSDYTNGDVDVFCIASSNGGRRWGQAVRVNSDPIHNGADQLFQWLAVDPTSGAINVMFYDRRRDPKNRQVEVVLARSTDEGKTFQNYLLSEQPYDPHGSSIGDYTALAAYAGRVYGSWTEVVPAGTSGSGGSSDLDGRQAIIRIGTADFRSGTESARTRN